MLNDRIFLVVTGSSLARAKKTEGRWEITHSFPGMKINCIAANSKRRSSVYLGTQHDGVFCSNDSGASWQQAGLQGIPVKSLAVDPNNPDIVYAGGKPVSLYRTIDGGNAWEELAVLRATRRWWWFSPADPPGITPYVSGLAVSPTDPQVLLAGIELGAVLRSEDGGKSWTRHLRGSYRDCHSLKFHCTNGQWAYEGGGGGVSFSRDGGRTWQRDKRGLGSKYGWWVAADPGEADLWYLSASEMPSLLRGEFIPPAHRDGAAQAHIYRKKGDAPWEQLGGGLPEPLNDMAYSLATLPDVPGVVYAGLANGDIWLSQNYGDLWERLPFNLGSMRSSMWVI